MKSILTLFCLLFLPALASATVGSWTLYYSEVNTVNSDGSVTVSPSVALVGNDGGWCSPLDENYGVEVPFILLNGNAWYGGDDYSVQSGDLDGENDINLAHTFSSVTIAPGGSADLAYGGKVTGLCRYNWDVEYDDSPWVETFYGAPWVDNLEPGTAPAPCFLGTNCTLPWPPSIQATQQPEIRMDLTSQQVAQTINSSCPTSVTLSSTTQLSLTANFPQYKTGIGILTAMQVNPSTQPDGTTNWNGTQIQEYVSVNSGSNTCPSNVPVCSQSGNPLTVGAGGNPGDTTFGAPFPPTANVFWDEHVRTDGTSLLNASGVTQTSCAMSCSQTYKCNGIIIGTFTINYSLSRGTIQGTPVTNVSVTKQ